MIPEQLALTFLAIVAGACIGIWLAIRKNPPR